MNVVFDFDNTLFETETLKQGLFEIAEEHGLTQEESRHVYEEARVSNGQATFSIKRFCEVLQAACTKKELAVSISPAFVRERIFQDTRLVEGAGELLKELQARGIELFLLSLGVPEWQKEKVDLAGIGAFFDEKNIIYTTDVKKGKIEMLRERFGAEFVGKDVVVFNDKPDETAEMLREFPELRAYVRRDEGDTRYSQEDFGDLTEEFNGRVTWETDLKKGYEFISPREPYGEVRR